MEQPTTATESASSVNTVTINIAIFLNFIVVPTFITYFSQLYHNRYMLSSKKIKYLINNFDNYIVKKVVGDDRQKNVDFTNFTFP